MLTLTKLGTNLWCYLKRKFWNDDKAAVQKKKSEEK